MNNGRNSNTPLIIACALLAAAVAAVFGVAALRNREPAKPPTPQATEAAARAAERARARQDLAQFERLAPPSAGPAASEARTRAAFSDLQRSLDRWHDAYRVAVVSPRAGLGSHITTLQGIRRDWMAIQTPACATSPASTVAAAMDAHINALLLFLADAQLGKAAFEPSTASADAQMRTGTDGISSCRALMLGPAQ